MFQGLVDLPWWGYVVVALACTHVTIAAVTIYLHRNQAHRALDLHPAVAHFFRFWLWLTTGMSTKGWAAVHRKHHARVETADDPHSPQVLGIRKVLTEGAELYRASAKDPEVLEKFGHGTPDDWLERRLYSRGDNAGIGLMLVINFTLFGFLGVTIWAVQMMWIPIFAAGVINGIGHWWGYRNFESLDASRNIVPWGILIGGEELHNNHHAFASAAKFSVKPWEFDIGWLYIRVLQALGLARVKKLPPVPQVRPEKRGIDLDTVRAVIANRLHVMSEYARSVVGAVYKEEVARAVGHGRSLLKTTRKLLAREDALLDDHARRSLAQGLALSERLEVVYQFKLRLQAIWSERSATHDTLVHALAEWCHQAEQTGIRALQEFADRLRGYTLAPA